jgi:anti-anti-sigma factor
MSTTFAPLGESEVFALREKDGVFVLELRGELGSLGWKSRNEARVLSAIEGSTGPRLVVDLTGVTYGGSELMAFLFRLRRRLRGCGGQLALAGVKGNVRAVLHVVRLDRVLGLYDSADAAVAALNDGELYEASGTGPE